MKIKPDKVILFESLILLISFIFRSSIKFPIFGTAPFLNILIGLVYGGALFLITRLALHFKVKPILTFLWEFHKNYLNSKPVNNLTYRPILIALPEELLFRGILLSSIGFLPSNILFSLIHSLVFTNKITTFVSIFIYGSVFSFLAYSTNSLIAPIICHWIFTVLRIWYFPKYIQKNPGLFRS